ncbi:MAG: hypothetical protein KKF44_02095 [Nanoarchaeota archaeon]|nr:hypothetical protein [Nanoarchaeota archaeon]
MDKKARIAIISAAVFALVVLAVFAISKPTERAVTACKDGTDNDGDGYTDYPNDPGCSSKNDKTETDSGVECDDGTDNDGDGDTDTNDGGCTGPADTDETDCGDGVCEGPETQGNCPQDCGYPDSCSDTDGGNYPLTFGTTSGYYNDNPYSNNDYCVDSGNVMEYYCSGDYEQSQQQSCGTDTYGANYCNGDTVYRDLTDYFCESGECDNTVTPELVENCESPFYCSGGQCVVDNSCSDTDGGIVYTTAGTASGYRWGDAYSFPDFCVGDYLVEFYCIGVFPLNQTVSCVANTTTTCTGGACV